MRKLIIFCALAALLSASARAQNIEATNVYFGGSGAVSSQETTGSSAPTGSCTGLTRYVQTTATTGALIITTATNYGLTVVETANSNDVPIFAQANITTAGDFASIGVGTDTAAYDSARLQFTFVSTGSVSNFASLGMAGQNQALNVFGDGDVVINSKTDNGYALQVSGTTDFTGNALMGGMLGVTGAATFSSTVAASGAVSGSNLTSAGHASLDLLSTTAASTYAPLASPTFTGTLSAASETLSGTLGVTGATTLSSTVGVSGMLTLGTATLLTTSTAFTNGSGSSTGTLTNAPSVGNPTKWIAINDNGTVRHIPAW